MKIPLWLKIQSQRTLWDLGLFNVHIANMLASQGITYREGYALPIYKSIEEITRNLQKIKWTEDPWSGKLDIVKHPTFMQEAIEIHPDYSGDCDDFALYCCAALVQSKLVKIEDIYFCSAMWVVNQSKGEITGHAVCSFKLDSGGWYWMGNWNKCVPIPMSNQHGWVEGILGRIGNPQLVVAGRIQIASVKKDDTVVPGKAQRCR